MAATGKQAALEMIEIMIFYKGCFQNTRTDKSCVILSHTTRTVYKIIYLYAFDSFPTMYTYI